MNDLLLGGSTTCRRQSLEPTWPWLKKRVEKEVGLDLTNDGVQPDVMQRGRAVIACQRSKSQDVRAATYTWNVSSMVSRSGRVVDALNRGNVDFSCAQETRCKCEDGWCYW